MSRTYLWGISGMKPPSAGWGIVTGACDVAEGCCSSAPRKGNWPRCSRLASAVGTGGFRGCSSTRVIGAFDRLLLWASRLSKNDEIDCDTICVICAIWSSLKAAREASGRMIAAWWTASRILDCGGSCIWLPCLQGITKALSLVLKT